MLVEEGKRDSVADQSLFSVAVLIYWFTAIRARVVARREDKVEARMLIRISRQLCEVEV